MSILVEKITLPKYNPKDPLYTHIPACICVYPNGTAKLNILIPQSNGGYLKDLNDYAIRELPKRHGDLIDKEPIKKFITNGINKQGQDSFGYDGIEILAEVEYAPVIIKAEE